MTISEWLPTLSTERLDDLEMAIGHERCKRERPKVPDAIVDAEVNRLLAVQAERHAVAAQEWKEHVERTFRRRIGDFEKGRQGMCNCRGCLAGYVTQNAELMCQKGQHEFWADVNRWKPYTA